MRVLFHSFRVTSTFIIIVIFIAFAQDVLAEDTENCFLCHKYSGLGVIDEEIQNGISSHSYPINAAAAMEGWWG